RARLRGGLQRSCDMDRRMVARLCRRSLAMLAAISIGAAVRAETELAAYLGTSATGDSDVTLAGRTFQGVSWSTRSLRAPAYYGVRAAHFFAGSGWGLAIDF